LNSSHVLSHSSFLSPPEVANCHYRQRLPADVDFPYEPNTRRSFQLK
jgi:hypothetical protein